MALNGRPFKEGINITSTTAGASADVLFTVPSNHDAEVTFLDLSNGSGANVDVSVEIYDADDTAYTNITNGLTVANKENNNLLLGDRIYLSPGDKVVASVSSGNCDITISGLLHFSQVR